MKTFKEYIASTDKTLDEGFAKTASVLGLAIKHRNLKQASIQKLKSAAASAGRVRAAKDDSEKLNLIADSLGDLAFALQNFAEMSGENISVSVAAALLGRDNARSRR